jgi:hypothetical protein
MPGVPDRSRFLNDPWGKNLEPGDVFEVACRYGDLVVRAPRPSRHHTILQIAYQLGFTRSPHGDDQGFVLKDGTYVTRSEAANIALASGQVEKLIAPPDLYSEDLF